MNWREVRDKLNKEAEIIQLVPPDEVVKMFKYQIMVSGEGVGDQTFTTMVFVAGDCRALAFYNVLCLVRLVDAPSLTLEHLKLLFREYVPFSAEFLGACGLHKLWELTQDVMGVLDSLQTKDELRELLEGLCFYISVIHGWIHHFFPWYIGELFPQRSADDLKEMDRLRRI